jgi:hypothetical protein
MAQRRTLLARGDLREVDNGKRAPVNGRPAHDGLGLAACAAQRRAVSKTQHERRAAGGNPPILKIVCGDSCRL